MATLSIVLNKSKRNRLPSGTTVTVRRWVKSTPGCQGRVLPNVARGPISTAPLDKWFTGLNLLLGGGNYYRQWGGRKKHIRMTVVLMVSKVVVISVWLHWRLFLCFCGRCSGWIIAIVFCITHRVCGSRIGTLEIGERSPIWRFCYDRRKIIRILMKVLEHLSVLNLLKYIKIISI